MIKGSYTRGRRSGEARERIYKRAMILICRVRLTCRLSPSTALILQLNSFLQLQLDVALPDAYVIS